MRIAVYIVDALLEGDVTRDRLNRIYNRLYKSADRTVKQAKPCQFQKDAEGNTICAGCKGHPAHDPNDPMHRHYDTRAGDLCCQGCEHHGEKGCQALKPLACKTWLCPTAARNAPAAASRLRDIQARASAARLLDLRGSKQQAMDYAAKVWGVQNNPPYTSGESVPESRRQNRYNPKGLHRDHRGRLLDKWGRVMEPDWEDFEKRRDKQMNPLHNSTVALHQVAEMLESTNWDAKIKRFEKSTRKLVGKTKKTLKGWEKSLGKARPKQQ